MGRPTNEVLEARRAQENATTRRFLSDHLDEWFWMRVEHRWPDYFSKQTWAGKFAQFSQNNMYLPIMNDRSMALFYREMDVITGKPVVFERFAWSRDSHQTPDGDWIVAEEHKQSLLALYRYAKQWKDGMGAIRYVIGTCSDLNPSLIKRDMGGEYMVDVRA